MWQNCSLFKGSAANTSEPSSLQIPTLKTDWVIAEIQQWKTGNQGRPLSPTGSCVFNHWLQQWISSSRGFFWKRICTSEALMDLGYRPQQFGTQKKSKRNKWCQAFDIFCIVPHYVQRPFQENVCLVLTLTCALLCVMLSCTLSR